MENDQPGNFICRFCRGSFTQAHHLHKHVQLIHAAIPSTKNNRTCPICGTVFAKYEGYRTHLRHIHGQRNEGQIFAFKCFNDFFLWKSELEKRSSCKYSLHAAPKLLPSNEKIHVYHCDTALKKKKNSCSASISCTAMICATESLKNHEIKVEYWNTHVGHLVQVEDDELNAAINSVQSSEEPTMHVMDLLNSIDQSIETGAEVFVTETIEEEHPLSPVPKRNQKNIFNIKKTKSSLVTSPKTPPIVQNFSFKKDPSKKKESSIYSLASVACGKISANKTIKSTEKNISKIFQNSPKKSVPKSVTSNPICGLKNIANSISELNNEDTLNYLDDIPNSSLQNVSIGGQVNSLNSSPSIKNKKLYDWPVGKPLPTDWMFSGYTPSVEKKSKKLKEKENRSSISNNIIVSLELDDNKSKQEKNVKTKDPKADVPLSASKLKTKVSSSITPVVVTTNANQFAKPVVPLNAIPSTVSPQIVNPMQNFSPAQLVPSVLPPAPTYISVNDKLIPYTPCGLPPNMNSNVLLPILNSPPPSLLQTSAIKANSSTLKGTGSSHQPPTVGVVKQNTIAPLAGAIPVLPNSFPNSHFILLPCTNNSAIPTLFPVPSTTMSSPLVLQNVTPTPLAPGSKVLMSSLLKPVATSPSQQAMSLVVPASSSVSTNLTNTVKVQKVSLPTSSSSMGTADPEESNVNSFQTFSQPSQVSSVVLNTAPISSTPTINIPGTNKTAVQKPGTFIFESPSGELYMLEPLDDDLVSKDSNASLTPTSKKVLDSPKSKSLKRKHFTKANNEFTEVTKTASPTIGAVKKKVNFAENSNFSEELESSLCKFKKTVLEDQNETTVDSDITISVQNDTVPTQKTEMTIKIVPSGHLGEKEVSIFTNTSPEDLKTKLPVNPSKYSPSLLTVKTVPSFSLHQSRPVTSTLNSFKTSSPLVTSSYNYVSPTSQSTTSINESTPLLPCGKETIEGLPHQETSTQNVEVKRNVTIKSVVQEKRSAMDDDLEVMKKVKFYKLEMKYLACQEECKKLKIELAKALSKNKELLQGIEEKKNNV